MENIVHPSVALVVYLLHHCVLLDLSERQSRWDVLLYIFSSRVLSRAFRVFNIRHHLGIVSVRLWDTHDS